MQLKRMPQGGQCSYENSTELYKTNNNVARYIYTAKFSNRYATAIGLYTSDALKINAEVANI